MALAAAKSLPNSLLLSMVPDEIVRVAMLKHAVKQKRRIAALRTGSATASKSLEDSATGKQEYGDVTQFSKKHHRALNTCTPSKRAVLR